MRFRKKPVVIEASCYDPNDVTSRQRLINWMGDACRHTVIDDAGCEQESLNLYIRTLEGDMRISPGDWVIQGTAGEFYPCKPDVFADVYEPAEDE